MITKKLFISGLLLCLGVFLLYQFLDNQLRKNYIFINNQKIYIEIADTDEKRAKGLSGRKNLGDNEGMLFVFPAKNIYPFWMKGMNFPLDFIWIDDFTIVDLTRNAPPLAEEKNLSVFYTSKEKINRVLEVKAGKIDEWKINIGDRILL